MGPRIFDLDGAALLTALFLVGCAPNTAIAERSDAGPGNAGPFDAGPLDAGPKDADPPDAGRPPAGTLIANSVADFSLVQGFRNWSYGYVEPATSPDFQLMTQTGDVDGFMPPSGELWSTWAVAPGRYWTKLFAIGAHANGIITSQSRTPVDQYAVRRWSSSVEGAVVVSGELAKIDVSTASNGVDARIEVDKILVYQQFLSGMDNAGYSFEAPVTVHVGSVVDFILDPHAENDVADLTRFTATISY